MQKIKRYRSADCVIGGFRYAEKEQAGRKVVGSLLLSLFDDEGLLHHVGFSSAIQAKDKPALPDSLENIAQKSSFTGNAPGGPSRWSINGHPSDAHEAEKCRRSLLRSFYRRALQTRHVCRQMADGQAACPMHHGPAEADDFANVGSRYHPFAEPDLKRPEDLKRQAMIRGGKPRTRSTQTPSRNAGGLLVHALP